MYEYTFVKMDTVHGFTKWEPKEDYHKIVEQYAAEGWRLVQIFSPPVSRHGLPEFYELIFERSRKE